MDLLKSRLPSFTMTVYPLDDFLRVNVPHENVSEQDATSIRLTLVKIISTYSEKSEFGWMSFLSHPFAGGYVVEFLNLKMVFCHLGIIEMVTLSEGYKEEECRKYAQELLKVAYNYLATLQKSLGEVLFPGL